MIYDPASFPFLGPVREAWRDVLREYEDVRGFAGAWPQPHVHNGKWNVVSIINNLGMGPPTTPAPRTSELCAAIPGLVTVGFSVLAPGAEIYPHIDDMSGILRAHLGLLTNPDCALEVADEVRSWREGEWLVFDENVSHSAWNRGKTDRVVLIVDFKEGRAT